MTYRSTGFEFLKQFFCFPETFLTLFKFASFCVIFLRGSLIRKYWLERMENLR